MDGLAGALCPPRIAPVVMPCNPRTRVVVGTALWRRAVALVAPAVRARPWPTRACAVMLRGSVTPRPNRCSAPRVALNVLLAQRLPPEPNTRRVLDVVAVAAPSMSLVDMGGGSRVALLRTAVPPRLWRPRWCRPLGDREPDLPRFPGTPPSCGAPPNDNGADTDPSATPNPTSSSP